MVLTAVATLGCGGKGGAPVTLLPPKTIASSSLYAAKCATPRSGLDGVTGTPYPDMQGTLPDEKNWLRSWANELYLLLEPVLVQDGAGRRQLGVGGSRPRARSRRRLDEALLGEDRAQRRALRASPQARCEDRAAGGDPVRIPVDGRATLTAGLQLG